MRADVPRFAPKERARTWGTKTSQTLRTILVVWRAFGDAFMPSDIIGLFWGFRKVGCGGREILLSGVVEAGGYAVHGGADGVVKRWVRNSSALAAQQVDLNQAERIDVGIAQAHGSEQDGILLQ